MSKLVDDCACELLDKLWGFKEVPGCDPLDLIFEVLLFVLGQQDFEADVQELKVCVVLWRKFQESRSRLLELLLLEIGPEDVCDAGCLDLVEFLSSRL